MINKIIALIETFTGFKNHSQFVKCDNGILVMNVKATPEQESQLLALATQFDENWSVISEPNPTGFNNKNGKPYAPTVYIGLVNNKTEDDVKDMFSSFSS
jgi:hypothetical protein